ncbi:2OG-Fe dioxygenase family protein [soil metagenome]
MTTTVPLVPLRDAEHALREHGYALLGAQDFATWAQASLHELDALRSSWDSLPADAWLKDGGRYRRRRHASYVVRADGPIESVEHRAHWQPVEYNALHGGLERWFDPVEPATAALPAWDHTLRALASTASALRGRQDWFIEAHQFRIDTQGGIGRPTPEGAHRDGVDLVAVVLVSREGIKGGESRVFDADGPSGIRFTMLEPWTCLLLDDSKVIHESTPIQPLAEPGGHRDTWVITARSGGFPGPVTRREATRPETSGP